jgi:predicted dehydrogenase
MAMRAGKPCYIEKPLAASYADCIRINRISEETGVPCFVAYYRRYLPYFQKVKEIIKNGTVGDVVNVQVRFSVPPRDLDYSRGDTLPWRLQPDISGGGYFYDLAPHQLDLLQDIFGVITRAHGYPANRAHLYQAEDTISACFYFESGIPGSGSWCFVGHESAKEDRIEVIGTRGTVSFSVFNYDPIRLVTSEGDMNIEVPNPPYVQLPIIKSVIEDMQGIGTCECTSISATPTNWVLDRILWKD